MSSVENFMESSLDESPILTGKDVDLKGRASATGSGCQNDPGGFAIHIDFWGCDTVINSYGGLQPGTGKSRTRAE